MDEKQEAIASMFAITRAFFILCREMESAGVMRRSTLAEAIQEDYLQHLSAGRSEESLEAYHSFAVRLAEVPGDSTA